MAYSIMMYAHKAEIMWLDEIAEALRNCADGLDSYLLMKMNMLHSERMVISKADKFQKIVENSQRSICYSIGSVAYRLIQVD